MTSTPFQIGRIYRDSGRPVTLPDFLADGETHRTNAAPLCDLCNDTGMVKEASIRCPLCKNTARGTDHSSLSDADRRVLADAEMRARAVGHRPGWAIDSSPEGRAARQKTFDAMAEYDEERENAWRNLPSNVVTPSVTAADTNTDLRRAPDQADHRTTDQIAADHRVEMEQRYKDYETAAQNAWKNLR